MPDLGPASALTRSTAGDCHSGANVRHYVADKLTRAALRHGTFLTTQLTMDGPIDRPDLAVRAGVDLRVHTRLEDAEADWRRLEANGVLTPYQRFDWIRALIASGLERVERLAIAIFYDQGTPLALLPLTIEGRLGYTEARFIGTSLANGDWLACDAAFAKKLTPQCLLQLLRETARMSGGIDLVRAYNQPAAWQGVANPLLALSSFPAPNNLYFAELGAAKLSYAEHRIPAKRRGNLRRGRRRLEESFGKVELRRATDSAELDRQHRSFLDQRARRFAEMGVENVFGEPAFIDFFRLLATASLGQPRPALVFHALYAGSEIVATSIGACQDTHFSQYINSTTSGPAGKYSLTDVLLAGLFDELVAAGFTSMDMGAGDFDYKTDWTAPRPMFHSVIALTTRGRLAVPWLDLGRRVKRTIKQNQRLWALAQSARRCAYRMRHGG